MAGEGDLIELTLREQDLFRRILQDFVNRAAGRLWQQGVDPRVILLAFGEALSEMFGPDVQVGWQPGHRAPEVGDPGPVPSTE